MKNKKQLLEIIKYPDKILTSACNEYVEEFGGEWLYDLATNMIHTMKSVRGVGLAAPQIGLPLRIAVALIGNIPTVLINPVIVEKSDKKIAISEGCLSCPEKEVRVDRANSVKVEFFNIKGKKSTNLFYGINAIIVLHEIDHLNGKLIIDYEKADGNISIEEHVK